jgi:ribonuclease D
VSLVQLATLETAYLFQLEKCGFPDALAEFFADDSVKKIGVGIKHDLEKLQELKKFTPAGFIDLSKIAREKGIIQIGARSLTARYMEGRLVKSSQKTNWAKRNLTRKQQLYAASDAWICLELYPRLTADKTDYRQFIEEESQDDNNENGDNDE